MTSTATKHPLRELRLFARGEAGSDERQRVVRHLLRGCASCAGALRAELTPKADLEALSAAVDRVLERSRELIERTEQSRTQASQGLERLEAMSDNQQEAWIDALSPMDRPAVVETLLSRCRELRHESSALHLRWAKLTLRTAEGAVAEDRLELAARAWAELGNAHRLPGNLTAAEQALQQARKHLGQVSRPSTDDTDTLAEAELVNAEAALAHDLREYDQAIAGYREARQLYRAMGDEERVLSCTISLAGIVARTQELEDGIEMLEELLLLDDLDTFHLRRYALNNLADLYLEAGNVEQATRWAEEAWNLAGESYPHLEQLRFQWLFGRLARERGELEKAASLLEECHQSYIEQDHPYEVALVALDLAVVYIRLGEWDRLGRLAQETVRIFRALGISRESIMALKVLNQAETAEALEVVAHLTPVVKLSRRHF